MILPPKTSVAEYIFLVCPFCEISNTSRLADMAEWWTETRSPVLAISFTWVQENPLSIMIEFQSEMKSWKILLGLLSFTPSKLANSCCVSSSTILILFFSDEDQTSSFVFELMPSILKKSHVNDYDEKWWRFVGWYRWLLMVDLGNRSAFHLAIALISRRRDWMNPLFHWSLEAFFLLTFLCWDFEIWRWINFIP